MDLNVKFIYIDQELVNVKTNAVLRLLRDALQQQQKERKVKNVKA